jgi:flagellar biosynthetic protein FliR
MEALLSLLNEEVLFHFLLLFARILGFMAFMPIFSHASVSAPMRVALSFLMAVFLFSVVEINSTVTADTFIQGLVAEVALGLAAAFFVNIIFDSVKIIGEFVGYATALSMANFFDPASGSQLGIVAKFLFYIALALFFETGMYEMTIVMLVKSFSMVNLGGFDIFSFDGVQILIDEIGRMFAFALSFAIPLFFIGFIIDMYYGYGTKSMPAFSPFVITFQIKFTLIFLFMMFGMEIFAENFTNYFMTKFN